jgi:large subunit ribosomal protein L4
MLTLFSGRGGAPIFPLHPRDHAQLLPRKVRSLGLRTALSSKLSSGLLRVVQDLSEAGWEGTNEARRALCDEYPESQSESDSESWSDLTEDALGASSDSELTSITRRFGTPRDLSVLFLHAPAYTPEDIRRIEQLSRAVRNLSGVDVVSTDEVTVWHVLKYQWTVMEGSAVDALVGEDEEVGMEWAERVERVEDGEAATDGARAKRAEEHLAA